jgi:hypothetical protein
VVIGFLWERKQQQGQKTMVTSFRDFSRTMKFRAGKGQIAMTADEYARIPNLNGQEHVADPIIHVKYFNPCGSETWYIMELDKETGDTFGFFTSSMCREGEMGYASIPELADIVLRFGLGIERDIHWKPTPLSKVRK